MLSYFVDLFIVSIENTVPVGFEGELISIALVLGVIDPFSDSMHGMNLSSLDSL